MDSQLSTLLHSRFGELTRGDYRRFVEGSGKDHPKEYFSISSPASRFEFGKASRFQHCGAQSIAVSQAGSLQPVTIQICRPFTPPLTMIVLLFCAYGCLALLSFRVIHHLEKGSTSALVTLVKDCGVQLDGSKSLIEVLSQIRSMSHELDSARKREIETAKAIALGDLAANVAHDLRSPLTSLSVLSEEYGELSEAKRSMLRRAVTRINDIANTLLESARGKEKSDQKPNCEVPDQRDLESHGISPLVASLLTEKRTMYRRHLALRIDCSLRESSYGLFARVQPREFQRVLSNLVDNSVESMNGEGCIVVDLCGDGADAQLTITDEGKGIPAEILPKLMRRGATFGKQNGNGMGLHHAKTAVESWGGRISIESEVGKGTRVTIRFPKASAPKWFVPELPVSPTGWFYVVDDDMSIHELWAGKLDKAPEGAGEPRIRSFSCPKELRAWVAEHGKERDATYLIDYKFAGTEETGLDLILALGLTKQCCLVTSHHEDRKVLEACESLGIRLIPKSDLSLVPIKPLSPPPRLVNLDSVLIHRDKSFRMSWWLSAKQQGLSVTSLKTRLTLLPSKLTDARKLPVVCAIPGGPGLSSKTLIGIEAVSEELDLALIDPPGTWGGKAVVSPTLEEVISSIETKIAELGRPVALVGHSFGGVYAGLLGVRAKIPVKHLVFMSAILTRAGAESLRNSYSTDKSRALVEAEKRHEETPNDETFRAWLASYGRLFFREGTEADGARILLASQTSYESFKSIRPGLPPGQDFEEELATLSVPKLLIGGQSDNLVKPEAVSAEAVRLRGRLETIRDVGHFITFDQPRILCRLIGDFISPGRLD